MTGLSRRNFLQTTGAAAGGVFLAGCSEKKKEDPYALEKPSVPGAERWAKGEERWVASTCSQCHVGCGILVRVVEGRVIKIEGNPVCPLNMGALGPKGQSGVHLLYHPDRLRGPLRRVGPRGSGRWKSIHWQEAIAEIGAKLHQLRSSGDAQGLVVLDGEPRGLMPQLWERFLEAYGSPNHINHRSATDGAKTLAMRYMQGIPELPAYDWERVSYILGFGANLLESWCQTIHFMRASAQLRGKVPGRRGKFVQVSPLFSITATKADEWIPLEPGSYGALALGFGHVLIKDGLYDKAFVEEHTFGFEDWIDAEGQKHRGFRDFVLKDYSPEIVAGLTGVSVQTIKRLAWEMAKNQPTVVVADDTATATSNGLGTAMAIHALNALLGNLERPGGVLVQHPAPLSPWPPVKLDEVARMNRSAVRIDGAGTATCPLGEGFIQGLPEAILSKNPYPTSALFLYRSNPIFSKPDGRRWIEAIRQVPLVVSFSPLPDESTFWADFVLPDHTYLERWEVVEPAPTLGYPILGLRQPAVVPLYNTRATGDVVIQLAQAIRSPVSDALSWADFRAAALERLKGILEVKSGSIVTARMPELIKKLEREGGWWSPEYPFEEWERAFRTPSGKFEFYSQTIASRLAELFPNAGEREKYLKAQGVATRGDELCLPHWEAPRFAGEAGEYPFVLIAYRSIDYAEGGARHLPLLRELPEAGHGGGWQDQVEIHPEDAAQLGIRDGEIVWVESPVGKYRLMVRFLNGIRPGTVGLHLGHGPWPPAPPSEPTQRGSSYGLLANVSDPLAGILALQGTRVRIRKES